MSMKKGSKFYTFAEFDNCLKLHKENISRSFRIDDSVTLKKARRFYPIYQNAPEEFRYKRLKLVCEYAGTFKTKGIGKKIKGSKRQGCPAYINVLLRFEGKYYLEINSMHSKHNCVKIYPKYRKEIQTEEKIKKSEEKVKTRYNAKEDSHNDATCFEENEHDSVNPLDSLDLFINEVEVEYKDEDPSDLSNVTMDEIQDELDNESPSDSLNVPMDETQKELDNQSPSDSPMVQIQNKNAFHMTIKKGSKFYSFADFDNCLKLHKEKISRSFRIDDSITLKKARKFDPFFQDVPQELRYRRIKLVCEYAGTFKTRSKGKRIKASKRQGCPAYINVLLRFEEKYFLEINSMHSKHTCVKIYPEYRKEIQTEEKLQKSGGNIKTRSKAKEDAHNDATCFEENEHDHVNPLDSLDLDMFINEVEYKDEDPSDSLNVTMDEIQKEHDNENPSDLLNVPMDEIQKEHENKSPSDLLNVPMNETQKEHENKSPSDSLNVPMDEIQSPSDSLNVPMDEIQNKNGATHVKNSNLDFRLLSSKIDKLIAVQQHTLETMSNLSMKLERRNAIERNKAASLAKIAEVLMKKFR